MNRSVMLVCATLATVLACTNRQDEVNEVKVAELRGADHGGRHDDVGVAVANYMIARWPNLQLEDNTCTDCFSLNYAPTNHNGSNWVELTILSRGNRYVQ